MNKESGISLEFAVAVVKKLEWRLALPCFEYCEKDNLVNLVTSYCFKTFSTTCIIKTT